MYNLLLLSAARPRTVGVSLFMALYLLYLVPSSINEFVDLNPSRSYYEVGSSVMLNCSIPISRYIDTDVIINIQWNNNITQSISVESNIKEFNHSITLNQLKLSDAGEYNCTYYFAGANENQFVIPSDRKTVTNNINIKSKCIYPFITNSSFC